MHSRRLARFLFAAVVLLGSCALGSALADECDAWVQATLDTQEQGSNTTKLEFAVEVSVQENCAHVTYDLVVGELMPNGQTKKVRLPRMVKLNDGSFDEVVRHEMPASHSVQDYEAKIVSCSTCDIMP